MTLEESKRAKEWSGRIKKNPSHDPRLCVLRVSISQPMAALYITLHIGMA